MKYIKRTKTKKSVTLNAIYVLLSVIIRSFLSSITTMIIINTMRINRVISRQNYKESF